MSRVGDLVFEAGRVVDVTDVADAKVRACGSSSIAAEDRAVMLAMLAGDDLVDLFRQIVTDDFGSAAALESFGNDPAPGVEDSRADLSGLDI